MVHTWETGPAGWAAAGGRPVIYTTEPQSPLPAGWGGALQNTQARLRRLGAIQRRRAELSDRIVGSTIISYTRPRQTPTTLPQAPAPQPTQVASPSSMGMAAAFTQATRWTAPTAVVSVEAALLEAQLARLEAQSARRESDDLRRALQQAQAR